MNAVTRIVFMGSPDFSVPSLEALTKTFDVVAVVTQPDKPSGRGKEIFESAVKKFALEKRLKIFQPPQLRGPACKRWQEKIKELNPDLIVVAAYGKILPKELLEIPKFGAINVHASLLPKYRGASPISEAIIQGESETGVTIMLMDEGMDTGDILSQEKIVIASDDTTATLSQKLSVLGAKLLIKTLKKYLAGEIKPQKQDDSLATYTKILKKEDGKINWNDSAFTIERKIRAYNPWPGTWTTRIKMLKATAEAGLRLQAVGKVCKDGKRIYVGCGENTRLVLELIQPENKSAMTPEAFALGHPDFVGSIL